MPAKLNRSPFRAVVCAAGALALLRPGVADAQDLQASAPLLRARQQAALGASRTEETALGVWVSLCLART